MASSSFSDAPNPETSEAEAKSVTIVINDNGEINYDEKTLQSIIGKSNFCFRNVLILLFQYGISNSFLQTQEFCFS